MRLLLAEDEPSLSRALVKILEHANYAVDAVFDGQEALDYLEAGHNYDGAILDIMMPKTDGLTVLQTIRRQGNRIPVLMLTAKSEIDDRVKGLDLGANDYLTKPFAPPELLARIRAMLRRKADFKPDLIRFGALSLDRQEMTLSCGRKTARLNNKTFQFMEMLMEQPGRVFDVNRIIERVWGWDSDSEMNVVWVTVFNLRKILKELGTKAVIRATRGVGYSLEEEK